MPLLRRRIHIPSSFEMAGGQNPIENISVPLFKIMDAIYYLLHFLNETMFVE